MIDVGLCGNMEKDTVVLGNGMMRRVSRPFFFKEKEKKRKDTPVRKSVSLI